MRKVLLLIFLAAAPAHAQQSSMLRLTFDEAIELAVTKNPTVEQAATGIVRAEALLQQARALTLPTVDAVMSTRTIGPLTTFAGQSITPRTQLNTSLAIAAPLLTPTLWAQRAQARDQVGVATRAVEDVRRQIAVATAEAYLTVIALRRVVELNERSRENARAHFEFAQQRYEGGLGSRLNALRAQQELSGDEAIVEEAGLSVRRAREALGVLVAADGPVDAAAEPVFDLPADVAPADSPATSPPWLLDRPDIRLLQARQSAAERVVSDSWKEWLFAQSRSWSASLLLSVPILDLGQRRGRARERESFLSLVRAERSETERQARSEVRTALEAVRSTERAHVSARAAADQAEEVVRITDVAFRTGATTNIEVIDAQRRARDAETRATIAEDAVRRAKLDLLVAIGRFPR
jgi:multidrug efflux system outer membrane protein